MHHSVINAISNNVCRIITIIVNIIITNDNVIIDDNGNTVGIVDVNRNYNGFDNDVNID